MKIVPLGTSGFFPSCGRETISCLVVSGTTAILIDAGTGVQRLSSPELQHTLRGIDTLNVIFSHFHLDHLAGLTWLVKIWPRRLRIFAPGRTFVESDAVNSLQTISQNPYFAKPLAEWPQQVSVSVFEGDFEIDDIIIKCLPQNHSGGSVGFRVEDFGFITDTVPNEEHIIFLENCKLVFFDTMHDNSDFSQFNSSGGYQEHGCPSVNGAVARASNIDMVGIYHIDPGYSDERVRTLLSEFRKEFQNSFIPEEGKGLVI